MLNTHSNRVKLANIGSDCEFLLSHSQNSIVTFKPNSNWLPRSVRESISTSLLSIALAIGVSDGNYAEEYSGNLGHINMPDPLAQIDSNQSYSAADIKDLDSYNFEFELQDKGINQETNDFWSKRVNQTDVKELADENERNLGISIERQRISDYEKIYSNITAQDAYGKIFDKIEVKIGSSLLFKLHVSYEVAGLIGGEPKLKLLEAHCSGSISFNLSDPSQRDILEELISRSQLTNSDISNENLFPIAPPFELAQHALLQSQEKGVIDQFYKANFELNDTYTDQIDAAARREGYANERYSAENTIIYDQKITLEEEGVSTDDQHTIIEVTTTNEAISQNWEAANFLPTREARVLSTVIDTSVQFYGSYSLSEESFISETLRSFVNEDSDTLEPVLTTEQRELKIASDYMYNELEIPEPISTEIHTSENIYFGDSATKSSGTVESIFREHTVDMVDSEFKFVDTFFTIDSDSQPIKVSELIVTETIDSKDIIERTLTNPIKSEDLTTDDYQIGVRKEDGKLEIWRQPSDNATSLLLHNGPPPPDQPISNKAREVLDDVDSTVMQKSKKLVHTTNYLHEVHQHDSVLSSVDLTPH